MQISIQLKYPALGTSNWLPPPCPGAAGGQSTAILELHDRMQHLRLLIYMCWGNASRFSKPWFSITYSGERLICNTFRNDETFPHHRGWENHPPEEWSRKVAHRVVVEERQCAAAVPALSSLPALPAKPGSSGETLCSAEQPLSWKNRTIREGREPRWRGEALIS